MNEGPDQQSFVVPDVGRASSSPAGWLWLIYLYFRPRTFFAHFVVDSTPGLTALCAWFYGMAGIIDEVETRALVDPTLLRSITWAQLWIGTLVGGIVTGWLYYKIGGWWYRVRLKFAGASQPDKSLARRVYLFASMVWALPAVLTQLLETGSHASPWEYYQSEGSGWSIFLLFIALFWSEWISYVGVRTAFVVRRGLALLWFLILPTALYGLILLGGVALALITGLGPADIDDPLPFDEGKSFAFSYPGNWWIDREMEEYDPNSNVSVEPLHEAVARLMYYELDQDVRSEADSSVELYEGFMESLTQIEDFNSWGRYPGLGQSLRGMIDGEQYTLRIFISEPRDGHVFEVHELWLDADTANVVPGFELVRSTFTLK